MNARKRRAPEPLLPVRSTKVPRTARSHPQGGHATVSQTESEGLIERWTMFGEMFMKLGVDTIHYVCCLFGMTVSVQHDLVLMCPTAGTPTSQQDEREHDRSVRTRQPEPSASAKRAPIEPPPPPRAPTRPSDDPSRSRRMLPPPPPRPSSSSQTGRELRIQKTGLPSPPTTNVSLDSSTSSGSLTGYHPEIDAALQKVQSRERRSSQTSREREHIYARKVCTSCSCSACTVADCANDRSIKWSLVKSGRVNKRRWRKKRSRQLGEVVRCSGFVASSFLQHHSGDDVNFNDFKGESVC